MSQRSNITAEEMRFANEELMSELMETRRNQRGRRRGKSGIGSRISGRTPEPTPGESENIAAETTRLPGATPVPTTSGRQPRTRKRRGKRFGDENEEEAVGMGSDMSIKGLIDEEVWDVDADAMRAFRGLTVWRNPVLGDEPGRPALFHTVKTGYQTFAEERTEFKLGDTSASWAGNNPTSSSQADIGGPGGEYSSFLPESIRELAGVDATTMKPADLASLTLALSANLTPREREDAAAAVDHILSRGQSTQNKQRT